MGIEVTTAYYTEGSAESAWRAARDHREGITGRCYFSEIMTNFDDSLIASSGWFDRKSRRSILALSV
jgi:hypothetical protein